MTNTEKESILSKIKKLMAMTVERGATPEEAATAAAKVQQILMEHNLSMTEAEAHDPQMAREKYDRTDWDIPFGSTPAIKWAKSLVGVIAKHNFARILVETGTRRVFIIGKKSNVEVILYLSDTIGRQIHKMAHDTMRRELGSTSNYTYYNAFCRGAVYTIDERLGKQSRAQQTANAAVGNMLMVINKELVDAQKAFFPRTGKARDGGVRDSGAYGAGREAGHKVAINKGVGSGGAGKTLRIGGK